LILNDIYIDDGLGERLSTESKKSEAKKAKGRVMNQGVPSSAHFCELERLARNLFAVGRSRAIVDNLLPD